MNLSIINMSARKNSFAFQNLHTPAKKLEKFWLMGYDVGKKSI